MNNRVCIQCKANPPRSESSDFCVSCYAARPKKKVLSAVAEKKLNTLIAKYKSKPRPQQIIEENFGGNCYGGCGKRVVGEFYCYDCRKKKAEKNFALKEGEVELYRAPIGDEADKLTKQIVVRDAASIKMSEMPWIWPDRIPDGAITWIMGQPNNAKSLLTIEIAACATTGRDWPDGSPNTMGKCKVLMYCGEDSLDKVVIPRLRAAKADLSQGMIGFMDRKSFRTIAGDNDPEKRALDLSQDLDDLLAMIKANPGYKLIIVDPITGVFGNKSISKNEEANPILEQLIDFCEGAGIAFVGILHVPKRTTNSAIEKIAGGSAVGGSAKSAFMLSRDPETNNVHDHLLTMVKWNYTGKAEGIKYKTVETVVEHDGMTLKVPKIEWGEATDKIADDVLVAQNSKKDDGDRQQGKCEAFLRTFLAAGVRRSPDVYDAALKQGFSEATVKRALKAVKGGHIDRRNYHQGYWMTLTPGVPFNPAPEIQEPMMALAQGEGL